MWTMFCAGVSVGMVARSKEPPRSQESRALMLRRLLRFAFVSSLARGWLQKSPRWFSIAAAILFFRFIDARAARARRVKRGSA